MTVPGDSDQQQLRHAAQATVDILGEWRRGVVDFFNFTASMADMDGSDSDGSDSDGSDMDGSDSDGSDFPIEMIDVTGIMGEAPMRARHAAGHYADCDPDPVRKPRTRCHMSVQMRHELDRRKRRATKNITKKAAYEKKRQEERRAVARRLRYDKEVLILKDKMKMLAHAHLHFGTDHMLPPGLTHGFAEQLHVKTFAVLKVYEALLATNPEDGFSLEACAAVAAADIGCHGASAKSILAWEREFRKNGGTFNGTRRGFNERVLLIDEPELRKRATKFVKVRGQPRGNTSMSVQDFADFINGTNLGGQNMPTGPPG